MPPLVVSLSRTQEELRVRIRQPELKGTAPKLINAGFDLMMKSGRAASATFELAPAYSL